MLGEFDSEADCCVPKAPAVQDEKDSLSVVWGGNDLGGGPVVRYLEVNPRVGSPPKKAYVTLPCVPRYG